jgi:DNA modification methylase
MELPTNKIISGDCLEVMKTFPDESVDLIATDPPYGYSFMGKDWDKAVPSVEVWKECLRVLKSGAFMFVMSAPRQDVLSQMIVRLGQAGFETGFTSIYWAYASGFPKAMNVSLAVDKQECRKQLREKLGREPTKDEFNEAWKTFREVIGKTERHNGRAFGEGMGDEQYGTYKGGIPDLTEPASKEAKSLDGSYGGFQPKPAVEIIIVCMKPLSEKTYVEQALKNGKGVTWLEKCRIPVNPEIDEMLKETKRDKRASEAWEKGSGFKNEANVLTGVHPEGRFPANLLVSDDVLNDGIPRKSGVFDNEKHQYHVPKTDGKYGEYQTNCPNQVSYGDSGSFSRFFDLDKWAEARKIGGQPNNQNARKHHINQEYFSVIDTPDKAYWLGFISGDGWIGYRPEKTDYRLQINLSIMDIDHLAKFVSCIDGNPYEMLKIKDNEIVSLVVASKQMVEDLIKLGLPTEDKSHSLKPLYLSTELMKYYWLGLFDADGCCGIYDKISNYKERSYQYKVFSMSLVGSEDICNAFSSYLGYSNVYPKTSVFQFSKTTSKTEVAFNIYQKLYDEFDLSLERKRRIFEEFLSIKQLQIENLPEDVKRTFPFLICPKASKRERDKGCEQLEPKRKSEITSQNMENALTGSGNVRNPFHRNNHPTVKPLKLMSYLVTLGSREGDVVLDPFVGSGTTCLASEILNRRWIGIDISPEYVEIARKRLGSIPNTLTTFF